MHGIVTVADVRRAEILKAKVINSGVEILLFQKRWRSYTVNNLTTDSNGIIETSPTRLTSASQPAETPRVAKMRAAARGEVSSASTFDFSTAPVFPAAALAPAPSVGPADNLLLASEKDKVITISITIPPVSEYTVSDGDGLFLIIDSSDVLTDGILIRPLDSTTDLPGAVISAALPAANRTEGVHSLRYVITDSFGDNGEFSVPAPFTVDTVAPGGELGFSAASFGVLEDDIAENGITAALLAANADILPADIGGYTGAALDDQLVPYVDDVPGTPVFVGNPNSRSIPVHFTYTTAQITAAGDGVKKFQYQVTDRAGNVGEMSLPREFETLLAGTITLLLAPPVAAMADAVIIDAEARKGVLVTIPAHVDVIAGLWVVVTWGGIELAPAQIITTNTAQDVLVTPAQVFRQDTGSFDVSYEIYKEGTSGKLMLLGISPGTPVVVDLTTPGEVDPDPTTPGNENLGLPIVRGGSAGGTDNVLTVADSTLTATITIPWLTVTTPPVPAYIANDIITVYWNGTSPEGSPIGVIIADDHPVTGADVVAGIDLVLDVLPSEHQAVGGGVPVTYRASRPVVGFPGKFNHAMSPSQTVTVESAPVLPGGPGGLPLVLWSEQLPLGPFFPGEFAINKVQSFDGSKIEIPFYENKNLGDRIDYTYIAQLGGFAGKPDGAEISTTRITGFYEVPIQEETTASFITLPAYGFFKTVASTPVDSVGFQGSGKFEYTVTPAATNVATPALPTKINIDTRLMPIK